MAFPKQDPFKTIMDSGSYLDGKLVGGYVPHPQANYLRLLALYKNSTVQSVLQEMIHEWMQQQEPRDSIIETLADRAYMEWIRRDRDFHAWNAYEKEIKDRLVKKKLSEEDINDILKEMRDRIGKNK